MLIEQVMIEEHRKEKIGEKKGLQEKFPSSTGFFLRIHTLPWILGLE